VTSEALQTNCSELVGTTAGSSGHTAWLLAEHLSHANPALDGAERVLLIESDAALAQPGVHRQKLHMILSAMRHFARELREQGVEVDLRRSATLAAGVRAHRAAHDGPEVRILEPTGTLSHRFVSVLPGVTVVKESLFLTTDEQFSAWASGRKRLVMEGFYREQRRRLDVLMDGDEPVEGQWNFDHDNRRKPPKGLIPPRVWMPAEDDIDADVRRDLDGARLASFGHDGPRRWPVTAAEADAALEDFIIRRLAEFGPWQDAMLGGQRMLWHAGLAAPMNLGLLDPLVMVRAAEAAYRDGRAPIGSVEGFVRQIIGWREYVHGIYRLRRADWDGMNALDADRALPAVFWGGPTEMACMGDAISGLEATGYAHHIERLMLFGNLQLLLGVDPAEALRWFRVTHVDGHDWVMAPNVLGMALFADGGRMMTKPYAASGAYINRMSDHCAGCRYTPTVRHGADACPFTTLYWDFLDRNRGRLGTNPRMALAVKNLDRLAPDEINAIRAQAAILTADFSA
jgi:deoxyribodipyrimidine photolyase-related protein